MVRVMQVLVLLAVTGGCGLKQITSPGAVALTLAGAPSTAVVGTPISFTLTALDSTGAVATGYAGTVTFTSSDFLATKPADTEFLAADAGVKTFTNAFTFGAAGDQFLVATDTSNLELVANANIAVSAAALHCVDYGGAPTTVPAGDGMTAAAPVQDMALDFNENPVLVYLAGSPGGTLAYAKNWSGSGWSAYGGVNVSPITTATASPGTPHLLLDIADRPYVAFANLDPNAPGTAAIMMLSWSGSDWQGVGGSDTAQGMAGTVSSQATPEVSLALDANGNPWVAWDHDDPNEVRARAWGHGAWAGAGNELLASPARRPVLAIPATGLPLAAWTDSSGAQPTILAQQWNGGAWVPLGDGGVVSSGSGPVMSDRPRIAFKSDGTPVIAWEALNQAGVMNVYARSWTGTGWADLAGSGQGNGVSASAGSAAQHPALAVGPGDHVWLAWEDARSGQIYLREYTGTAWVEVGASASGNGISNTSLTARWPRLQVSTRGTPVLAYEEVSGSNILLHVCPWK